MNKSPLVSTFALVLALAAPFSLAAQERGVQQFDPQLTTRVDLLRQELRAQGKDFEVGVNPAMQYSLEQLCGLRPELRQYDFAARAQGGHLNFEVEDLTATAYPATFIGWFSPVKDQGQCGSCWAFATIGNLEGAALKKQGAPQGRVSASGSIIPSGLVTSLSEQQVLSCNPDGYGCQGGWYSYDMLMPSNLNRGAGYYKGAVPAAAFPYVSNRVACSFSAQTSYTPVTQWGYVGNGYTVPSVTAIKAAITKWGSVSVGVYADRAFQAYRSGVFTGTDNRSQPNHAVLLVGWDDAKGAWLLKNSWSSQWGINGFMWIKYGVNSVGTAPAWVMN